MSNKEPSHTVLKGDAAMALWRKGRNDWNAWVAENPEADIDFSGQHFEGVERDKRPPLIDFQRFVFPTGNVNFMNANFGEEDVDFSDATFGEGNVDFSDANFGEGNVYFSDANFGKGDVDFMNATFGEGYVNFMNANFGEGDVYFMNANFGEEDVDFSDANFGEGDVYFMNATFGKGSVDFMNATFGKGSVDFEDANFGEGNVYFSGANFGEGDVDFSNATFGEGNVDFSDATFGEGNVYFSNANFGEGNVNFEDATFGEGNVNFEDAKFGSGSLQFNRATFASDRVTFRYCQFGGPAHFVDLRQMDRLNTFSFEGAGFEKLFTFSHDGKMGCPLDLRRTKMSHDVVVNDIECDFDVKPMPKWASLASQYWSGMPERSAPTWRWTTKAKDREDSQRFRRLKELALSNRNHGKALEFHVQEVQSKRGDRTKPWQTAAQFFFWLLGDYGRSVILPFGWLITTWFGFAAYFFAYSTEQSAKFSAALAYSGSHMLSFIPTGRTARLQGQEWLFGEDTLVPVWALGAGAAESILSVILLFLLGLGLRNLFRV